jgi:hypothetical protein
VNMYMCDVAHECLPESPLPGTVILEVWYLDLGYRKSIGDFHVERMFET